MGDIAGHEGGMMAEAPGECRELMGIKTCLECPLDDCYHNNNLRGEVEKWRKRSAKEKPLTKYTVGCIKKAK